MASAPGVKPSIFASVVLLFTILYGCRGPGIAPNAAQQPTAGGPQSRPPSPVFARVDAVTPTPAVVTLNGDGPITPATVGVAGVVGRLMEEGSLTPLADVELYLVRLEGTGDFPVAVLDRNTDPFARTDFGGHFRLQDVKPGRYVIVAGSVGSGGMIANGSTGETLVIQVAPAKQTNVGTIVMGKP